MLLTSFVFQEYTTCLFVYSFLLSVYIIFYSSLWDRVGFLLLLLGACGVFYLSGVCRDQVFFFSSSDRHVRPHYHDVTDTLSVANTELMILTCDGLIQTP